MIKGKLFGIISLLLATALVAVMGIASCSSSGGDSNGAPASASAVSIGAMTKGSVIVNGVRFEDTGASITADDTPKVLGDGMMVKVRGTINDDGLNGTAERIEVENEVRGTIETKDVAASKFTVLGQTVMVDGGTFFADAVPTNDFAGLAVGDQVEVHGSRDLAGDIRATRVQELGTGAVNDEIRGPVAGLNTTAQTFTIGSLTVSYAGATIEPAGSLANGIIVEVHLTAGTNTATRIELEDLEDDGFRHGEGQEFEVEGLISGFAVGSSAFKVANEPVLINSSTRFEGGIKDELANDIKVEAEGHNRSNGSLVAEKITFKGNVRIEANADSVDVAGNTITILGKSVKLTSKTDVDNLSGGISGIVAGTSGLRIRGFVNTDKTTITATRIDSRNSVGLDEIRLQGPVTSKDAANKKLVILGITIDASGPLQSLMDDSPSDDDNLGQPFANLDAFLAAVTVDRTVVKAKGTFSGSTLLATELEIE